MVACSALFTENVYRKVIVRDAADKHYVLVGRIVSVLVVVCGVVFAFSLEGVIEGLEIFWKISAMMGLAFWLGLFWRRTTVAGAWVGTLVGFAAFLFTSTIKVLDTVLWDFNARYATTLQAIWEPLTYLRETKDGLRLELALPWQMVFYLTAGLVTLVVVSLLTPRVSKKKLDRFYACLRTPVEPDEPETEPFTLPPGVQPAPRRVILDVFDLEIPVMSKTGIVGVLAAAVAVAALIAGVYFIFSLGA